MVFIFFFKLQVVAVPHDRIVNLLATSVGEVGFSILIKKILINNL